MNGRDRLKQNFPIGVKYCQHRDMQEQFWNTDMENIKKSGIDTLRIHAFWAALEPSEGKYDFEQYDRIVEKAQKYGLKILFTLYLVSAPEWIFEKHPDARFVSANGTVWDSNQFPDNAHGGWPGLCFDSDAFRNTVENFVKVFVEHFKNSENVLAIDIWHEPDEEPAQQYAQNDWHELMYCYCKHSVEKFRNWMKKKYGSLEQINKTWTRHYEKWEQLQPPKNYGTYTEWLDWKKFRMEQLEDQVSWLNSLIKKYDPDRATSVHSGIYEIRHPICSSNNHFRLAELTDMYACSMYDTIHPEVSGFTCDLMRGACDNDSYWIGETETGSGPMFIFLGEEPEDYFAFSRPADPEEIWKLSWGAVARGAKGIMYWGWRPDVSTMETVSLGFTERDGELTDRTEMIQEFTSLIRKNEKELVQARAPLSDFAVFYNIDAIITEGFASLGNSGNCIVSLKKRFFKDTLSYIGCYKTLMRNGIQPDFVDEKGIRSGKLSQYKVLVLPYSIVITKEIAEVLKAYVAEGGKIISDGMCGFFTDDGWGSQVCPANGLDEVFGLKVRSNYELISTCDINLDGDICKGTGRFIRERVMTYENAEVLAAFEDGKPAVLSSHYGKGSTVYVATQLFATAVTGAMNEIDKVFGKILDTIGYTKKINIKNLSKDGLVEVRKQIGDSSEFIFVINHSQITENITLDITTEYQGNMEIICGEQDAPIFREDKGRITGSLEMQPSKVLIFRVER